MREADLQDFFRREQDSGGTVEALTLPAADLRELAIDVLGSGPVTIASPGAPGSVTGGALVTHVSNRAAGNLAVPLGLAPEGEPATALVRRPVTAGVQ